MGGMGLFLVDVAPTGDKRVEIERLGECLLREHLTRPIVSVKPQRSFRGVLHISMTDLPFILGRMGVNRERQKVLNLGL